LLQGGKEYLMRAHFGLPSVVSEETEGKPPIQVKFEIPYFTTSGIQVLGSIIFANFFVCVRLCRPPSCAGSMKLIGRYFPHSQSGQDPSN
jgi:hypothetical protein